MSDPSLPLPFEVEDLEPESEGEGTGWPETDHYRLLSVPLIVRTTRRAFAEALRWHLAPFHRDGPTTGNGPVVEVWLKGEQEVGEEEGPEAQYVYARDGEVVRIAAPESVLEYALWDANAVATGHGRDFLFLHAGAVVRDGGAVLLPAMMDAGKSTLTAALLAEGYAYLSDELGAIDPVTVHAYPYPKHLSLDPEALSFLPGLRDRLDDRSGLSARLGQRFVRPRNLGAEVAAPAPVRWLVFLGARGSGPPRLAPLSRSEAVHRLVLHSFNLDLYGERGLVLLGRLVEGAEVSVLEGGAPQQRAALLAERLR